MGKRLDSDLCRISIYAHQVSNDCIRTLNTVAGEQLGRQFLHCGRNVDIVWQNDALTYR
jgi:hypothetical protein